MAEGTYALSMDAAEFYESAFVSALFGGWAAGLVDLAAPKPGQTVLDVACGTALPFDNGSFDVVFCQAALMLFDDRVGALRELARVAGPTGAVAVLIPGRVRIVAGCSTALARFIDDRTGAIAAPIQAHLIIAHVDQKPHRTR